MGSVVTVRAATDADSTGSRTSSWMNCIRDGKCNGGRALSVITAGDPCTTRAKHKHVRLRLAFSFRMIHSSKGGHRRCHRVRVTSDKSPAVVRYCKAAQTLYQQESFARSQRVPLAITEPLVTLDGCGTGVQQCLRTHAIAQDVSCISTGRPILPAAVHPTARLRLPAHQRQVPMTWRSAIGLTAHKTWHDDCCRPVQQRLVHVSNHTHHNM